LLFFGQPTEAQKKSLKVAKHAKKLEQTAGKAAQKT
jgi:hypothetical protein